jgi:hypothetical protein
MDRVNGLAEQMKVERAFRTLLKNGSGLAEIRMILEDYGYQKGDRFQAALIRPECAVKNEWSGYYELLNLSIKSVCIEHIEYHHDGVAFQASLCFFCSRETVIRTVRNCWSSWE